jgi:hypothetical protein
MGNKVRLSLAEFRNRCLGKYSEYMHTHTIASWPVKIINTAFTTTVEINVIAIECSP